MRTEHEQTFEELRKRIADAIDKAQRSTRFGLEPNSDDEEQCGDIVCVFARDMDRVIDILMRDMDRVIDILMRMRSKQEGST